MNLISYLRRGISYTLRGVPVNVVNASIEKLSPCELLKDKKIIITGGGSGIGWEIAKFCKTQGALVLISGRNEKKLRLKASEINCYSIPLDLTDTHNFDSYIQNCEKTLGGLDILVNNAGISLHENSFLEVTPESFDIQIATNLKGPFFLTQSFIKYLTANNRKGQILMISSETGDTVDCRPYGYTKAAVNSMVKGLANLYKKDGIRINAIAPGVTATDMTQVANDGNLYAGDYGQGRFYLPEEMAQVACFLLSSAADCISGQIITCNNAQTVNPRWK